MAEKRINGSVIPYSESGDRAQDEVRFSQNSLFSINIHYEMFTQILLQPFTYLLQCQGKQIRVKLSLAFNYWLNIPPEKLGIINDVVQMLHNASLL